MEETKSINKTGMLVKKILIEGVIKAKTGLHIGGTNAGLSIGGADATVVRNPYNNEPYIPGSSLKGKMRSLLEKVEGRFGESLGDHVKYGPLTTFSMDDPVDVRLITGIFGTMPEKNKGSAEPPSRLIVRDCEMNSISSEKLINSKNTDMPFTEVKTEVVIDRITSAATPRQIERVPAGTEFNMRLILNIYGDDSEKYKSETNSNGETNMINKLCEALSLVQNDYIGGKGTRGSGEVEISVKNIFYKDKNSYENNIAWKEYEFQIPNELNKQEKN
jgi:CRISPR-associated protein Csm3